MTSDAKDTNTINGLGWQRVGVAVLTESFRWAAFGLTGATTQGAQTARIQESITFINGTGMDVAIDLFQLNQDPELLRGAFYKWVSHQTGPFTWTKWLQV